LLASKASDFYLKAMATLLTIAYETAVNVSLKDDFIYIGGSTFVVTEVR
jgi:hypothetical protein